jgi:hypothetical protein
VQELMRTHFRCKGLVLHTNEAGKSSQMQKNDLIERSVGLLNKIYSRQTTISSSLHRNRYFG